MAEDANPLPRPEEGVPPVPPVSSDTTKEELLKQNKSLKEQMEKVYRMTATVLVSRIVSEYSGFVAKECRFVAKLTVLCVFRGNQELSPHLLS
jgi:hypothetical protein